MATSFKKDYNCGLQFVLSAILILVVTLCNTGCGETGPTNQQPVIHFPLTMALSDSLGDEGNPLPDDIKSMLRPLEVKNCPNFVFIPDVTIVRLDVPDAKPEVLNLGIDQNPIQKGLRQPLTSEKARSVRNDALAIVKISSLMAQPKGESGIAISNLKKLLTSASNQNIFTTEGTKRELGETASNSSKTVVATDLNDLVAKMGLSFCGKPNSKPTASSSLIVYKTGDSSAISSPAGGNNSGPIASLGSEIQKENERIAAEDPQLRKKDAEKVTETFREKVKGDPIAMYRLTKTIIIGKDHHEAFEELGKAVRLAITQGKAQELIRLIDEDIKQDLTLDKSERTIWRLTTHPHDWTPIIKALMENDASLLEAEHDEKNRLKS